MDAIKIKSDDTKKKPNKIKTALLKAGETLLVNHNIDALAIDDIVQAAGVAKGSFYNYFTDKYSFAEEIRTNLRQELENEITRANEGVTDPALRVANGYAKYVHHILESDERASVFVRINVGFGTMEHTLNQGVVNDIASGLKAGRFITPSVKAGALFVVGTCYVALLNAVLEEGRYGALLIGQQLGAIMLRGLGIPNTEAETIIAMAFHQQEDNQFIG